MSRSKEQLAKLEEKAQKIKPDAKLANMYLATERFVDRVRFFEYLPFTLGMGVGGVAIAANEIARNFGINLDVSRFMDFAILSSLSTVVTVALGEKFLDITGQVDWRNALQTEVKRRGIKLDKYRKSN